MRLLLLLAVSVCGMVLHANMTLSIQPVTSPFEVSAASGASLAFHLQVSEGGVPAPLTDNVALAVEVLAYENADAGINIPAADDDWMLPQGFTGGKRTIDVAVAGVPPSEPHFATLTLEVDGFGDPILIEFDVIVRPGHDGQGTAVHFLISPQAGSAFSRWHAGAESHGTYEARLYRDFGEVSAIATIATPGADAATISDEMQLRLDELVDGELLPAVGMQVSGASFTAVDAGGDGIADLVQALFTISTPQPLDADPGARRVFKLIASRADESPPIEITLARIEITAREFASGGVWLDTHTTQVAYFERRQTPVLPSLLPRMYLNDQLMDEDAHATLTIEPSLANAYPDADTGLYNLGWTVRVDWNELKSRQAVEGGDTVRVELTFPGTSIQAIPAEFEVMMPGVLASVFGSLQELEDQEYDNEKSEKDYLDELLDALLDAGLEIRPDGGGYSFPGGFLDPSPDVVDPNWPGIRSKLDDLRAALLAFKNAERKQDGQDQTQGKRRWVIEVEVEINGETVRIILVIGGNATDGRQPGNPAIVISIGACGHDAGESSGATAGGNARVDVRSRGSLGIALGGQGGHGSDPDEPDESEPPGGNGGKAEVRIDTSRDDSGNGAPEGIALGGHGGDSAGQGGNGGDADVRISRGSRGQGTSNAGNGGDSGLPPSSSSTPRSGDASVRNADGVENRRTREERGGENRGNPGQVVGGIVTGTAGQPVSGTPGGVRHRGPITQDD